MLKACWLCFVILKKYVELTRRKIESRDPIFLTGTRACSRVSGNDRFFSAWLRIWAQPRNPCQPRNSASALTWLGGSTIQMEDGILSCDKQTYHHLRPSVCLCICPSVCLFIAVVFLFFFKTMYLSLGTYSFRVSRYAPRFCPPLHFLHWTIFLTMFTISFISCWVPFQILLIFII